LQRLLVAFITIFIIAGPCRKEKDYFFKFHTLFKKSTTGSCILYIEKRNGSAAVGVRKRKGALSVNIAYFLLPKSRIAYLYDDFTFRQGLEKMRNRGYTAIPVITRDGRVVYTPGLADCFNEKDGTAYVYQLLAS